MLGAPEPTPALRATGWRSFSAAPATRCPSPSLPGPTANPSVPCPFAGMTSTTDTPTRVPGSRGWSCEATQETSESAERSLPLRNVGASNKATARSGCTPRKPDASTSAAIGSWRLTSLDSAGTPSSASDSPPPNRASSAHEGACRKARMSTEINCLASARERPHDGAADRPVLLNRLSVEGCHLSPDRCRSADRADVS